MRRGVWKELKQIEKPTEIEQTQALRETLVVIWRSFRLAFAQRAPLRGDLLLVLLLHHHRGRGTGRRRRVELRCRVVGSGQHRAFRDPRVLNI